jgi:hypothetical protein
LFDFAGFLNGPTLIVVERPVASSFFPLFHTLRNSKPLYEGLWPKRSASGLRKKTASRRASFLNDLFIDAAIISGKHSGIPL